MKKWVLILGMFFSMIAGAQTLPQKLSGEYLINSHPESLSGGVYSLARINPNDAYEYGVHVQFYSDSQTYRSFDTAPCGNQCFSSTEGRYELVDSEHIRLIMLMRERGGSPCSENYHLEMNEDLGIFRIESTENGLMLIPVDN